ncbi:MAG: MBL fold metallo-hydrolase [Hydrogenibacillus sp.]|nr:MBL fold metallo-hydrolase [Hydrogenibacillus sp.]
MPAISLGEVKCITLPTPFRVGAVNVYVVYGDGLVLVDTGPNTDEAWAALVQGLRSLGLHIRDFDALVLTHHHIDHVGLSARLLDVRPMPLYAHPSAVPYVTQDMSFLVERQAFLEALYRKSGVPEPLIAEARKVYADYVRFMEPLAPDGIETVREGDALPMLPGWRVLHTPGHAPDHVSLYREATGELIGGDHLLGHISSNAFVEPAYGTPERPRSLVVYREALSRLLALPLCIVYPGHGEEVTDPHAIIRERLVKQEERAELILGLLHEEPTAFGLSRRVFPKLYEKEMPLVISEIVGHLDFLVELGRVTVEAGERFLYRAHVRGESASEKS